jgi:hypothetical protein
VFESSTINIVLIVVIALLVLGAVAFARRS